MSSAQMTDRPLYLRIKIGTNCSDGTTMQGSDTEFRTKNFARFIRKTGVKRFIDSFDNEPAILTPKDAEARALPLVKSILESCPVQWFDRCERSRVEEANESDTNAT